MRVPDDWLDAVFFLGVDVPAAGGAVATRYGGTGFYFRMQNEFDSDLSKLYLVTAAHNIRESRKAPGALYVRVNTVGGGSKKVEVSRDAWVAHKDPSVDLAILATHPGRRGPALVHTYVESDAYLTDEIINTHDIGVGSEVTTVGLFSMREGVDRNLPILRSGILAAMPGEPIYDGPRPPYQAYLIEMLSIGGLSGSPVFVHPIAGPHHRHPRRVRADGRVQTHTEWTQGSFLMGIVRSHWDERPPPPDDQLPYREWINRGIAAVTPISGLDEVLAYEEVRRYRRDEARNATRRAKRKTKPQPGARLPTGAE